MSEASVDIVVEVVENYYPQQAAGKDQFLWDLQIRWYGEIQVIPGYDTAGDAVNAVIEKYPFSTIRVEIIPLATKEKVNA